MENLMRGKMDQTVMITGASNARLVYILTTDDYVMLLRL